jgi:hypothetical protein
MPFVALGLDQFAKPLTYYEEKDNYVYAPAERESVISFGRPLYVLRREFLIALK